MLIGMQVSSVQGSVMGSSRMDHSFVVLPKQKALGHGVPPRPRGGPPLSETSQLTKAMEESFVVLPPAAASMYKGESTSEGGGVQIPAYGENPSNPLQANNGGFHSTITVLKRAFDIATSQTQVQLAFFFFFFCIEHLLCVQCILFCYVLLELIAQCL